MFHARSKLLLPLLVQSFSLLYAADGLPKVAWVELKPDKENPVYHRYSNLDDSRAKAYAMSEMVRRMGQDQCAQRLNLAGALHLHPELTDLAIVHIAVEHARDYWEDVFRYFQSGGFSWMAPGDFVSLFGLAVPPDSTPGNLQNHTLETHARANTDIASRVALLAWLDSPELIKFVGGQQAVERMNGRAYFDLAYILRIQLSMEAIHQAWSKAPATASQWDLVDLGVRSADALKEAAKGSFFLYRGHDLLRDTDFLRYARGETPVLRLGLALSEARQRLNQWVRAPIPPPLRAAMNTYLDDCQRLGFRSTHPFFEALLDHIALFVDDLN